MPGIGVQIDSVETLLEKDRELREGDKESSSKVLEESLFKQSLAGHIITEFNVNQEAKESGGIKDEIIDSLRSFNGEYSPDDLSRIEEEGGSQIFMNITATKCRAAKSWIADILKPAKGKAWTVMPTPLADLPQEITKQLEEAINREFNKADLESQQKLQPGEARSTIEAQETIRDTNQKRRDLKVALREEIQKEAKFQMDIMERQIEDQLVEGGWGKSLLTFIDDFCWSPTAFLKGPVVSREPKLTWRAGRPVKELQIIFGNDRVDPLDMYPSPNATEIDDGNLIEHMRLSRKDLAGLRDVVGYQKEAIDKVLEGPSDNQSTSNWWFSSDVEMEKASQERRGNEFEANRGVYHAMHFHGPLSTKVLKEWEYDCGGFDPENVDDSTMVEVEAILIENEVIKCVVNSDPLLRRPYYKASFVNRPGSFWGRSLPNLMRDIQRMCNATARALANNLGIASGPQVEVYIDRLASDDDVLEELRPRQIWQLKSDPAGSGGRAMNWFQPTSNAAELLKVYSEFELRADDVTGIPRYAYGNERMTGAAATVGGLSMLLESASKIIKDAVRNIDEGLIKPRVEYQFYMNMLENGSNFTGDVTVVPIGSAVLSIKAFEAMRRNEFLVATANQFDQETMGKNGRASILRSIAEDIGLDSNPIPTEFELKLQEEKNAKLVQAQQQAEAQEEDKKLQASIQATSLQIEGQKEMAAGAQQIQTADLVRKTRKDQADASIKLAEIDAKTQSVNKELAVKSITGEGI